MEELFERWQILQQKLEGVHSQEKIREIVRRHLAENERGELFVVQGGNEWLQQSQRRPVPQMLFSEFWHEGELCILFADTNLGKSILAVQIGEHISRGEAIPGFKLSCGSHVVLYCDFELAEKQFESRYSENYTKHYRFSPNFYRAEINPEVDASEYECYEDELNNALEQTIRKTNARVLIIDNLTYLKNETEKARSALALMKLLKSLKQKYGLSILALAHTPKRNASMPITKNDLQGSKMLINFCDSAFAIGESHADKSLRYLKQIKQRSTECVYDANNVVVCQTVKPGNFLHFEFLHYGKEAEHLKKITELEHQALEARVKELLDAEPEITIYAIAKQLCQDEGKFASFKVKVGRIVNRLKGVDKLIG